MEKRKPHYALDEIQFYVAIEGIRAFTASAIFNGAAMGLDDATMLATIAEMKRAMFYKSMTTHRDHTAWQDVYHVPLMDGRVAYVKLTQQDGTVVVQFKCKED
jgi:motility quorum-sensing regulator/GCU-specific mRNA interferase toxin